MTNTREILPGALIDCTGIDVHLTGSGVIHSEPGVFVLYADDVTIEQGRRIEVEDDPVIRVGIELALTGSLQLSGQLIANNAGGGSSIVVTANGFIDIDGANPGISAIGTNSGADGGEVVLFGDAAITIDKGVYFNGNTALGDDTEVTEGGSIVIEALGDITINDQLRAWGKWIGGGDIFIKTPTSLSINYTQGVGLPKGEISADGRATDGDGGIVELIGGTVLISGPIDLRGGTNATGGEAVGGLLFISAGCGGIVIEDTVDLSGGRLGGGSVDAQSKGPITLGGTIDVRARKYGGNGGSVELSSGRLLQLTDKAVINADGHDTNIVGENGEGGVVLVSGCTVNIMEGAETSAGMSAKGAYGGMLAVEGTNASTAFPSLRIASQTLLDTTGAISTGSVLLDVYYSFPGRCSNNMNATCRMDSECVFGCGNVGTCGSANPDTEGVNTQFKPAPVVTQTSELPPCNLTCN